MNILTIEADTQDLEFELHQSHISELVDKKIIIFDEHDNNDYYLLYGDTFKRTDVELLLVAIIGVESNE